MRVTQIKLELKHGSVHVEITNPRRRNEFKVDVLTRHHSGIWEKDEHELLTRREVFSLIKKIEPLAEPEILNAALENLAW